MAEAQVLENTKFSQYPLAMDEYFQKNEVIIKTFPDKYSNIREDSVPNIKITSTEQLYNFLQQEKQFWSNDLDRKIRILNCYSRINSAITCFDNSKRYYSSNNIGEGMRQLSMSIAYLNNNNDYLCSNTKLASLIVEQANDQNKTQFYFVGFDYALQCKDSGFSNFNTGVLEGYYEGLIYRGEIKRAVALTKKVIGDFSENVKSVNDNYSKLNEEYIKSFHEQEKRIADIKKQSDDEINNLKTQTEEFFKLKEERSKQLENLYENKLRLEKPAEYWKKMAESYSKKGIGWLVVSCVTAVAIIAMLILIICFVPNIYDTDSHWFDILKNTAILTVISSVAIYLLRIFVKMTMSSIHLSRDAKEREQLSYFYLALLNNDAVTDKEKALIINSLFSRSDTGLLKGESTPVMSTNVTEVIDKLQKG